MTAIYLRFPHGLGDVVQFSVVLKHLRKYRQDWVVDVRCGRGKHTALIGLCRRVYHDQEPEPVGPYQSVADLGFYENYCRYTDKPNSKVTNCLQEVFGLAYDASRIECGHGVKQAVDEWSNKYQKVWRLETWDAGPDGDTGMAVIWRVG